MEDLSLFRFLLSLALLFLYIGVCIIGLVGSFTIYTRYSKSSGQKKSPLLSHYPPLPGVSILRPLKGLDTQLQVCLESAFQQNYPQFEILFSVANELDPAANVAKALIAKYPNIPAQLIIGLTSWEKPDIGAEEIGPNPKINNLIRSYSLAKYDTIWILDSNTHVPPNTLRHSIQTFLDTECTPRPIQLIHHLPLCVISRPTEKTAWGALLEEIYLSTSHAKFYVSINRFGIAPCVMGKSNLFHKSSLDHATGSQGLVQFAQFIAEDHLIADTLWYHTPNPGPNHAMTADAARQPVQLESLATYFERRIRWIRVRKYMVTAATLIEPFTECFVAGLVGSFSISTIFGLRMRGIYFLHVAIWLLIDLYQFHTLQCNFAVDMLPDDETPEFARGNRTWSFKSLGRWLVCWSIRESTCLPIWIVAIFGQPVVKWRNRKFRVRRDMTVDEIR